jgi:hypothetical protein
MAAAAALRSIRLFPTICIDSPTRWTAGEVRMITDRDDWRPLSTATINVDEMFQSLRAELDD